MNATDANPHRAAVERLLEIATERGFTFTSAGEQGSRWGERTTPQWVDVVFLGGCGHCNAARARRGSLSPSEPLFADTVSGPALTVLRTVVYGWPGT